MLNGTNQQREKMIEINEEKNYLLEWLFINLGYTGTQMKPLRWSNWPSIINVIINLIINGIIFFIFFLNNQLTWQNSTNSFNNNDYKSLIKFIFIFSDHYEQVLWLLITIYQYIYMRSIVRSMSSSIFTTIYHHKRHLFIVYGITLTIMAPASLQEFSIIFFGSRLNIFENFCFAFIAYCINHSFLMPLIIMTYVKYATIVSLKSITNQINMNWNECMKIKQLATINRYFSQMLSPLLLFCVISFNLDIITLFFLVKKRKKFLLEFLLLSSFWNYLAFVLYLDKRIDELLENIIKNINNSQLKCCGQCHQYRQINCHHFSNSGLMKSFYCSRNVRSIEFYYQYLDDFHINLFNICRIDFVFLFDSCLFTISFIILSLQTL
ncbi:uncharacterized protein LOC124490292 [Dermatophagoides farinae]|uniref:uncharacterized protein LOC124490292 n=1 Tax=Dermatophagoides farinae TaxID=6954 RepID=UPI003F5FD164